MYNYKRLLVTAALPYANGPIHLGHLAGAYLPADVFVRYQRLQHRNVLFICGSDEHGVAITLTAEKEKVSPQTIVDKFHTSNAETFSKLGMSFDNYSRTSRPVHHEVAKEFFLDLLNKKFLTEKEEEQFYDDEAKMFLPDRYVEGECPKCGYDKARGDQCDNCGTYYNQLELKNPKSLVSGKTPTVKKTTHWYLKLQDFQKKLENYVEQHSIEWKDNVLQQTRSWLKEGLQERAVTRDLQWGVPVPLENAQGKVLYVWIEAVLGYISATKEWAKQKNTPDKWKEFWQDKETRYIAFIGKDNIVFHTIIFPILLMAKEGYILPYDVPANEFLNLEGGKFSKSRNHAVYVKDVLETFSPDLLRYSIATILPENKDSDFSWKDFQSKINNELADIYGNFVNRTLTFAFKNFGGKIPKLENPSLLDKEMIEYSKQAPQKIGNLFEHYKFREGVMEIMNVARTANKYFNDSEPWKTLKTNPQQSANTIHISLQIIRTLAILFSPIIPFSSEKIWKMLGMQKSIYDEQWNSAGELMLQEGQKINTPEIIFTKIEDTVIEQQTVKLEKPKEIVTEKKGQNFLPLKPTITIEDFQKIDLRVAKIISCEAVPKSKKLLKLQIDLGFEQRQIVAGIAEQRKPEELIGKSVIIVANLAPAKLMGVESQGMLLASHSNSNDFALLTISNEVELGSWIK